MTDRDPFGRPIARPELSKAERLPGTAAPPPPPPPRSSADRRRRLILAFVAFDVVLVAVVAALFLGGSGSDPVVDVPVADDPPAAVASKPAAAPDSAAEPQRARAAEPAGFNASSVLRPANLKRALASARRISHGRPLLVRAEAARLDVQVATSKGTLEIVQVPAQGAARLVTSVDGAARRRPTMAWSAIDATAPQRLARSTKSTASRGPTSTDYVVFLPQTRRWVLYRASGRGFTADPQGRGPVRISGP